MSILQLCRHCGNQIRTPFSHTPNFECSDCRPSGKKPKKRKYSKRKFSDIELPPFEKDPRSGAFFSLIDFMFDPVVSDVLDDSYEEALIAEGFQTVEVNFLPHRNNQPKWLRQFQRATLKAITLKYEDEEELFT